MLRIASRSSRGDCRSTSLNRSIIVSIFFGRFTPQRGPISDMRLRSSGGISGRRNTITRSRFSKTPPLWSHANDLAVERANMVERCGSDLRMSPDMGTNLSNCHQLLRDIQWTNDVQPLFDGL